MRKRIFFNKYSSMKFISHLDTLRLMDRLFKISGVELEYTQGFHPRPKMSFGNPISLGEEAYNEPMDVVIVDDSLLNEEIISKLNTSTPEGLNFVHIEEITNKSNIASDYDVLKYELKLDNIEDYNSLTSLLKQDEIIEIKEKKGKIKKRNLGIRIKDMSFKNEKQLLLLTLENMSPNAFLKMCEIEASDVNIKRLGYGKIKEIKE